MCANYASAEGKRRENQSYRVESYRHREGTILVAQSKFVKKTVKHKRFEHIDYDGEQYPNSNHQM